MREIKITKSKQLARDKKTIVVMVRDERRPSLRQRTLLETFSVAPPRNRARSNSLDAGRANRRRAAVDGQLEADAVVHRHNEIAPPVNGDDDMEVSSDYGNESLPSPPGSSVTNHQHRLQNKDSDDEMSLDDDDKKEPAAINTNTNPNRDNYKMETDYAIFLRDNPKINSRDLSKTRLRFPYPNCEHPPILHNLVELKNIKHRYGLDWTQVVGQCTYCKFQMEPTLSQAALDKQLVEKKEKATQELKQSTGDYGEYKYNHLMCEQRMEATNEHPHQRTAYQHHMAFENAKPDAVFAINTDLDLESPFIFVNIQIKCTNNITGYEFWDEESKNNIFQQKDFLLVIILRPRKRDWDAEPDKILVGFVDEYDLRNEKTFLYFDDNKNLLLSSNKLLFATIVRKYIHLRFDSDRDQKHNVSTVRDAIAPQHLSGMVEYKHYRQTLELGRHVDSDCMFRYYYVFNPTRAHDDNHIILQVENNSARKVQDKFLSYCCQSCDKYIRLSDAKEKIDYDDDAVDYKCYHCGHFTKTTKETRCFVLVTDQSKTNISLKPQKGLYHQEDFDAVRMVVGTESYFVPTAQLRTNKDGFINNLNGHNCENATRRVDHVCRFHSSYKLPTFNQIQMETICEIVRKVDEDKTNPLLPRDFLLFPPKQETPPAWVTFEEINVIMDNAGW